MKSKAKILGPLLKGLFGLQPLCSFAVMYLGWQLLKELRTILGPPGTVAAFLESNLSPEEQTQRDEELQRRLDLSSTQRNRPAFFAFSGEGHVLRSEANTPVSTVTQSGSEGEDDHVLTVKGEEVTGAGAVVGQQKLRSSMKKLTLTEDDNLRQSK